MSRRAVLWLVGAGAVIVVAAVIVVIVVVSNLRAAVQEADYRACLAAQGVYETTDIDTMVEVSSVCYNAVYGDD